MTVDPNDGHDSPEQMQELAKYTAKMVARREAVKNHDLNMEALGRAKAEFMTAYYKAEETAKLIDSQLFLRTDSSHGITTMAVVEQRKVNDYGR